MTHQSKKGSAEFMLAAATKTGITDNRTIRMSGNLPRSTIIAAAVLMLSAASASQAADIAASGVEIVGIIDAGLLYQSKTDQAGGGSKTSMETSGLRQSTLGFKGTRNLGDDLKGFFNLEAHFDTNNGNFHGTGDAEDTGNKLFRRQANLGLSGDWGSVTLGRQYGPALLAHIATEPRAFKEQFSNLYAWAYNQYAATAGGPGTDRNTNNDVGIFFSNAIQYRHTLGPVNFGILYAFGGKAGSLEKNSAYALGATYTGPVTLSASYQEVKDEATAHSNVRHGGLGIAVPFGDFTFKGNYLNAKNDTHLGAAVSDVDGRSVGVDWKWNAKNSATLAYYDNEDKRHTDDHTRNIVLSNDYTIMPNTTLYVQMAYVDAGSAATIKTSIVAAGIPAVGQKSTLLNVGLNFNF
jgi:predicted porin